MKTFYFTTNRREGIALSAKAKSWLGLPFVPIGTLFLALALVTPVSGQSITIFDAPGAGTGAFQGTYAFNIAPSGAIIGYSRDANNVRHGFIRSRNGSFTSFDAPGAGTAPGQGTRAYAINPSGEITGFLTDSSNAAHGFVRSNQGAIIVFDAPGAGTGPGQGTFCFSPLIINPNGAIAGYYVDSSGVRHGFVRTKTGTITTFDVPGAGTGAGQGTFSYAISQTGAITGYYYDSAGVSHGFLRDTNGVITTFDVPGSGTAPLQGTYGGGFTPSGTIMGNYVDTDNLSHGFLMDRTGAFTTFDAPDAGHVPGVDDGTYPFGINANGAITGWYVDDADANHGFVRDNQGNIVEFDIPGAGAGVFVWSISPSGAVTGYFWDANNVVHGFVREASGAALKSATITE
jgi:hypothetical protein